jgi:predicted  nucleic acid-binding Zn-ribbon protein
MENNFEDARTKPTIETILERINLLGTTLGGQIAELKLEVSEVKSDVSTLKSDMEFVKSDLTSFHKEFREFREEIDSRIDRIEGMTNKTRSEFLELRINFREWKQQLSS